MRVLINRLTAIRQRSGIGHYIAELLRHLGAQDLDGEVLTFPGVCVEGGINLGTAVRKRLGQWLPRRRAGTAPLPSSGKESRLKLGLHALARGWTNWHFRAFWSWRSFDLYHEPNSIPLSCDRPTVATVPDLSVVLHPEWHPADRVRYYEKHFERGLRRCCRVLAISEFTRQEVVQHFRVPAEQITTTYMGIRAGLHPLPESEKDAIRRRLGLPENFLLYLGTLEPRKNLLMLLRAYDDLPDAIRARCPLILAGGWGWKAEELRGFFDNRSRHRQVRYLGYFAERDLIGLYNCARALVFPSHYEGFGLPPLEMMACGGAVLASDIAPHREILGGRAALLAPEDLEGWRQTLHLAIEDDDWLRSKRHGVEEVARPFTWERCARDTWAAYQVALGKRGEARTEARAA